MARGRREGSAIVRLDDLGFGSEPFSGGEPFSLDIEFKPVGPVYVRDGILLEVPRSAMPDIVVGDRRWFRYVGQLTGEHVMELECTRMTDDKLEFEDF
jgi:hypothetical protein